MARSLSNVEVVAVSFHSGGISSLFLHSAARDKVKGRFISNVSVLNITLCHGKHVACHVAYELGVPELKFIWLNLYPTRVSTEILVHGS